MTSHPEHSRNTGSWAARLLTTAAVLLPAVTIAGTALVLGHRMPGTLPVHWSGFGTADRFGSFASVLWWTLGASVLAAALGVDAVHRRRPTTRGILSLGLALGGISAAIWLMTVATTLPVTDPATARLGWHVLWIPAGILWAGAVAMAAGRSTPPPRPGAEQSPDGRAGAAVLPPGLPVDDTGSAATTGDRPDAVPGERRVAWVAVLHARMFVIVPLLAAGVIAVVSLTVDPVIWPAIVLPLAVLSFFADLRVIADRRGLRVVAGPFATPIRRIPLSDIAAARAEHINPLRWGGWGYRAVPGRTALVLRAGPGLVVDLRDGRKFAVTVDHPDEPAALLTSLRNPVP